MFFFEKQPVTLFATLDDVVAHLRTHLPSFIAQLPDDYRLPSAHSDPRVEFFNYFFAGAPYSPRRKKPLWFLRAASRAFYELLRRNDQNELTDEYTVIGHEQTTGAIVRANRFTMYSYIVDAFQRFPLVQDFLTVAHNVPSSYTHRWQPHQTLAWNAEDSNLLHARVPQYDGVPLLPLKRVIGKYRTVPFRNA